MAEFYLNLEAVNQEAEKMNNSGAGGAAFFSRKKIAPNSDVDMRIMPPLKSMNGLFYLKVISFWINKKNYVSAKTFGEPCIGFEYMKSIEGSNNQEMKTLLKADSFSVVEEYLLPILLLKREGATNTVVDSCVKTFDCTWGLIKKFNNLVSHRNYQNGSPLGIMDPKLGFNVTVSKAVTSDRTSYDAMVIPQSAEMPAEYYDKIPDIAENTRWKMESQEYLQGVFENYFNNGPFPPESMKTKGAPASSIQTAPVAPLVAPVNAQVVPPVIPPVVQQAVPVVVQAAPVAPVVQITPSVEVVAPVVQAAPVTGGSLLDRLNKS